MLIWFTDTENKSGVKDLNTKQCHLESLFQTCIFWLAAFFSLYTDYLNQVAYITHNAT